MVTGPTYVSGRVALVATLSTGAVVFGNQEASISSIPYSSLGLRYGFLDPKKYESM
jgi:hypothetical protein